MAPGYTDLVDRWAASDRRAMTTDDATLSYAEWQRRGLRAARALVGLGLRRPARVAIVLPNGPDFAVLLYACARIGVTLVPVSTWAVGGELLRVLGAAGPEIVIVSDFSAGAAALDGALSIQTLLEHDCGDVEFEAACRDGRDDADLAILYTSGSTGAPKGVVLAQDTVRRNGAAIAARMGLGPADRVYSYFPMFFSGGLCNVLTGASAVGAELVTQARYRPESAADLIRDRGCTAHNVWHDGLAAVAEYLDAADLSRMRRGLLLDPALFERFGLPFDDGVNMYGMTETATAFTCHSHTEPEAVRRGSHGAPLDGNLVRIIDPDRGTPLAVGEPGEIAVRGPSLMRGYTDGSHLDLTDDDGYFHTGDLGRLDEAGHVHFAGRLRTLIKVKGLTVQPEEVEAVLGAHPAVRMCAVVGLGDGDESTGLAALVVCDDATSLAELDAHCRRELSSYKVPSLRRIAEHEFPLSASRKIDRLAARRIASKP